MITLHGHSDYSLLDGICKIPDYVARAKELGAEAVGLTDHGTLAGLVDLWFECKKQGIKPILGCEFYHVRKKSDKKNYHIILLARTYEGWMNMIELSNRAQDNFYKKPRITDKDIRELGRGIIGTAACLAGYLARTWAETGEFDHEWIKMMEESFDAFYFEVHDNGIPEQKAYNNALLKAYPDRCIAANDVHFLLEEHQFAHEVALAINTRKKITDPKAFKFNGSGYWMRSDLDLPEHTITRTHEVAALVEEFSIGYDEWHLPQVDVDEDNLWFRLNDELFVRGLDKPEYRERMEYEFKVIKENGFLPYFEIVSSIYRRFALEGRFVGWGRGSTGGSLVAYLMGITRIDPIEWGLIFERFLNPGRVTMPDIDMDFQPQDRALAIEELGRYGNAIQIGAYGTLGTKEVLNAVSKAMDIVTGLGALVPNEAPVPTIAELATTRAFSEQVAKERNQKLIEVCKILEGCKRSASTHAAGVVLVEGTIPVRESRSGVNKGLRSSEWDMYALEKLRYVKFDVLGVKNLEVVDATCRSVGIRPEEIPLADDATYSLIQSGQTIGVFQWESDGYRNLIRRLHPDSFDELLDLNTLYRPGCLESGITDEYIERKFGRKPVVQLHPKLNMRTQGLPLYQEDILVMARELAGFTLAEADILRKAIGKKEKETFAKIKEQFVDGCIQVSDISRSDADDYWSQIEKFARYTWNKAHAVAYTLISWWTAYLSANHTSHFICQLLNQASNGDRRRTLLSECRRRGVEVEYPDINRAARGYRVEDGAIISGLDGIKYVGEKTIQKILDDRDANGPYTDVEEFKRRTGSTKRVVEYLGYAGALQPLGIEKGDLDQERDALGYNMQDRQLDQWWYAKYMPQLGEVVELHKILTKKGDPMAFIKIETVEEVRSVTCFPDMWANIKEQMVPGAVAIFKWDHRDVLTYLASPDAFDDMKVYIPDSKVDEFLSFAPTLKGRPNVKITQYDVASVHLDNEMLEFIDGEFGIERIEV